METQLSCNYEGGRTPKWVFGELISELGDNRFLCMFSRWEGSMDQFGGAKFTGWKGEAHNTISVHGISQFLEEQGFEITGKARKMMMNS